MSSTDSFTRVRLFLQCPVGTSIDNSIGIYLGTVVDTSVGTNVGTTVGTSVGALVGIIMDTNTGTSTRETILSVGINVLLYVLPVVYYCY